MENNIDYLKNKAYKIAQKFIKSEFDEQIICAKLEKQGIPIDLAKEVALNIVIERNNYKKEEFSDYKKIGFIIIAIWVLVSITAYIITGRVFDAIGILVVGIPSTIVVHLMTTNE